MAPITSDLGAARPLVGVSPCLLGRLVRYDGGHKQHQVVRGLASQVRWLELCPEAAAGLGTPREPARLEGRGDDLAFVGLRSRTDFTGSLGGFIQRTVNTLPWGELAGWVFKARSPSCGVGTTPRFEPGRAEPWGAGHGLWSAALAAHDPHLPIIDEDGLADASERSRWWEEVKQRAGQTAR